MKPSVTTGTRRTVAPRQNPHIAAISRPPMHRKIPNGSWRLLAYRARRVEWRSASAPYTLHRRPRRSQPQLPWVHPSELRQWRLRTWCYQCPSRQTQKVASGPYGITSQFNTGFESGVHFNLCHRRAFTEIASAGSGAAADKLARKRERRRNTAIDHLQFGSARSGQRVDCNSATEKV